jgi:hypothetical protein
MEETPELQLAEEGMAFMGAVTQFLRSECLDLYTRSRTFIRGLGRHDGVSTQRLRLASPLKGFSEESSQRHIKRIRRSLELS